MRPRNKAEQLIQAGASLLTRLPKQGRNARFRYEMIQVMGRLFIEAGLREAALGTDPAFEYAGTKVRR